jgi:hypothetical protein
VEVFRTNQPRASTPESNERRSRHPDLNVPPQVIIVDELWQREGEIRRFAAKHGVPLSVVTTSKPRSSPAAYGFQNAWNTALSFARGAYVAITNDYSWLPQNFIETIMEFYESEASTLPFCARFDLNCPDSGAAWRNAETSGTWDLGTRGFALLSFPVIKFDVPEGEDQGQGPHMS